MKSRPSRSDMVSTRLTEAALLILLTVVVARATMLETLRDPFGANSPLNSRGAGPGTGLLLDLLCALPALLILLKRAIFREESVLKNWAAPLALLLGAFATISTLWSGDKFAALVSAAHFLAAMTVLWAAAQLITTWQRLRLVGAICAGLLVVCIVQAVMWRFVEMPTTLANFEHNRVQFLREMGWQPGDFAARQFENKVRNMEMLGFDASANSFAALMVLLLGVSAGLIIQRASEGRKLAAAGMALGIPLTAWILFYTQCKAAFVTPLIIAFALIVIWKFRPSLARHARRMYAIVLAATITGIAAVVAYGMAFGRLPTASLFFRWRYWVAATRMFAAHPILGVGWNNFGPNYLMFRLADAAEEIQDPHNFLLRFFTELGLIGGVLALAWLARFWWETTTQPASADAEDRLRGSITWVGIVAACSMVLALAVGTDFSQGLDSITLDVLKRLLFLCVLMLVASLAAISSLRDMRLDSRPAPWILYATLASLAAFLIHNLIEFAIFETGPMMLFALLAGSVLGARSKTAKTPARAVSLLQLSGAALVWFGAAALLAIPAAIAQSLASDGDDLVRSGQFDNAQASYLHAAEWIPFNADYLYRAGMALAQKPRRENSDRTAILELLNQAIARDPTAVVYYLSRAQLEAESADASSSTADFNKALELNPNEVSIRLNFGQALLQLHQPADAAHQFELALKYNSLLPPDEPKRMNEGSLRGQWAAALYSSGQMTAARDQAQAALAANAALPTDDPRRLSDEEAKQIQALLDAADKSLSH